MSTSPDRRGFTARQAAPRAELATALAAERAIVLRGAAKTRVIDGGWVVRHPPLPDIWHLNRVHLTGGVAPAGAGELEALVDAELGGGPGGDGASRGGGPGVLHRRVTLDDEATAEMLWPQLEPLRWRRERAVVMVRSGAHPLRAPAPAGTPPAIRTRALRESALCAFQGLAFAEDAAVIALGGELPVRLAAAQSVLRAGTPWRAFAAGRADGGMPAATATLYLDADVGGRRVAFVDQVATLRAHRERGLARAVMGAALKAAASWDADLVALFADAEDWPQVFYASLGFRTVGRQTVFHRDW
ncbi:MAG TPA: GNAT family N-acetyltransferase [Solirubrobacteraceae bacterium]|nr:GNAT family N-acetyltransferase [Solirubrobacteraceae bacterium]